MNINEKDEMILKTIYKAIDEKFGFDIKIYDLREKSTLSDFFVVASANNLPQVKAIAEYVEEKLQEQGIHAKNREGLTTKNWVLIEFQTVVVHIFNQEDRAYYTLDKVWEKAPEIVLDMK